MAQGQLSSDRARYSAEPATLEDVATISDMEMTIFNAWDATPFLEAGRKERFREFIEAKYRWHLQNDPSATVIKIVDPDNLSTIAAACMWHIYDPEQTGQRPLDPTFPIPFASPEERIEFNDLVQYKTDLRVVREKYMKDIEAFALPVWLMVKPEYRRLGLGTKLLHWGTDRADALGIPCILEASEAGAKVYVQHGFVEKEVFHTHMEMESGEKVVGGRVMIREPRKS